MSDLIFVWSAVDSRLVAIVAIAVIYVLFSLLKRP